MQVVFGLLGQVGCIGQDDSLGFWFCADFLSLVMTVIGIR